MKCFWLFLVSFSFPAYACSVCGFGDDGSRWAYLFTTGLLTIVPLGVFAALGFYIYRYYHKSSQDELG
ncbi:MAG: hypothetical protein KDD61_05560 [Bdellovibrionales bacterium]|nr:hypothetical protein [Bdellovibrionales bacterium]